MSGFTAFLGKELREILRTWRIWVLPGIVLFFAISGPPLAKITPELLGSLMADQQPGVVIQLPDPTYIDAYLQWTKNLSQMVLFAVIIMFGGIISAETKSGTAALVLTKPLSRSAFVLAKFVSQAALVAVPVVAGALATWGITYSVFGEAPLAPLAEATGAWLVFALMFVALMELLSSGVPVKVLVETDDLLEEASVGTGHFAFGVRSARLGNTATGLGGVFVTLLLVPLAMVGALAARDRCAGPVVLVGGRAP